MMKKSVLVAVMDSVFRSYREEEAVFSEAGMTMQVCNPGTEEEIIAAAAGADALLVNLHPVTDRIIRTLDRCRIISRYGVGFDNVDVEAATKKGIWVSNVPDYCVEETADHAIALLLACSRQVVQKHVNILEGSWKLENRFPVFRMGTRVLGIVGYGRIGSRLHRMLKGFGFREVLVCDPFIEKSVIEENGGTKVELPELLRKADYITLHVPLNAENYHMIGVREFGLMKEGAIFVNTSRGPLVDEDALAERLASGRLAGAGIDVFEKEPLPRTSPLLRLPNVVLSDHTSYFSAESVVELKTKAARNIVEVFRNGRPLYPVNEIGRRGK